MQYFTMDTPLVKTFFSLYPEARRNNPPERTAPRTWSPPVLGYFDTALYLF